MVCIIMIISDILVADVISQPVSVAALGGQQVYARCLLAYLFLMPDCSRIQAKFTGVLPLN